MKLLNAALLLISALILGLAPAWADSTNLLPSADTTLLESFPTNNLGALGTFIAGTTPRGRTRALLKFDLTVIPAGATVTSATLTLQVVARNSLNAVGSNFSFHRVLKDWAEGSEDGGNTGATALDGESSWINRFTPLQPWTPSGGGADVDYVSNGSATQFIDDLGSYTVNSTAALVADLQAWLDNPASNFGWLLMTDSEGTIYTSRRFSSREALSNQPTLTLQYTGGSQLPPPAAPLISNVVLVANQIHFSFNAESNRTYAVEFRTAVDNGNWSTLTNVPALQNPATIDVSDPISGPSRLYRIRTP